MQKIGLEAILDMANFKKGLKDFSSGITEMNSETEKAGGMLSKLGSIAGGLGKIGVTAAIAGIGALTGVIVGSISAAADAQKVEAQLDAVLKSTGGSAGMTKEALLGMATALSEVTPFEDELIISAETMLLQFKNIGEEVFPQATEMALDLAQRLGMDAAPAAQLLGKALESPGEGLLRLKQAGIAFTDEQTAMIKKMTDAGDAAGAQKYIMDQLALSVGGSARAAGDTFAGQMEIVKNKIGNVTEGIGAAFLPMVTQMVGKFSEFVTKNSPAIIAAFEELAAWLGTNIPIAVAALSEYWTTTLYPGLVQTWGFITTSLIPALSAIWSWFKTNLIPAIEEQVRKWKALAIGLQAIGDYVSGTLIPWFEALPDKLKAIIDTMKQIGTDIVTGIKQGISDAWDSFVSWILGKMGSIIKAIADFLGIGSPAKATMFIGEEMARGIAVGFANAMAGGLSAPGISVGRSTLSLAGGGAGTTNNSYGGDTIVLNINSRDAWAGAQSWIESRRRERINVGM